VQISSLFDKLEKSFISLTKSSAKINKAESVAATERVVQARSTKTASAKSAAAGSITSKVIGTLLGAGLAYILMKGNGKKDSPDAMEDMTNAAAGAVDWVKEKATEAAKAVVNWISAKALAITKAVSSGISAIYNSITTGLTWLKDGATSAYATIAEAATAFFNQSEDPGIETPDDSIAKSLSQRVKEAIAEFWRNVKGVVKEWLWSLFSNVIVGGKGAKKEGEDTPDASPAPEAVPGAAGGVGDGDRSNAHPFASAAYKPLQNPDQNITRWTPSAVPAVPHMPSDTSTNLPRLANTPIPFTGRSFAANGGSTGRGGIGGAYRNSSGIAYQPRSLHEKLGISAGQYDAFKEGLADIESSAVKNKPNVEDRYKLIGGSNNHFAGRYQMGFGGKHTEVKEAAHALREPVPSGTKFNSDPAMQERYFEKFTEAHHDQLMKNPKYANASPERKLEVLGYAHNQGAGGASKWLNTGQEGRDAFGTGGTKYVGSVRSRLDDYNSQIAKELGTDSKGKGSNAEASEALDIKLQRGGGAPSSAEPDESVAPADRSLGRERDDRSDNSDNNSGAQVGANEQTYGDTEINSGRRQLHHVNTSSGFLVIASDRYL
jgi:hypothetical protein